MNPWTMQDDLKPCPDCGDFVEGVVIDCETCDSTRLVHYSH